MPLQKQAVTVNFGQGLDTKTDPFQIPLGKFLSRENSVFDELGALKKRNGFGYLTTLPDTTSTFLTTFNGNLTAIGQDLKAFSSGQQLWVNKGQISPLSLSTLPLIRNSTNQSQCDAAISANGLVCTAYIDNITQASTTQAVVKFAVADVTTGQNIIAPSTITSSFGTPQFGPRVFVLGKYFIVAFATSSASASHLQYFAVNTATSATVSSATDISTSYSPSAGGSFDGVVANNNLYLAWNGASNSGVKSTFITSTLTQSSVITISSSAATIVSLNADITQPTPIIWNAFYFNGSTSGSVVATTLVSGSGSSQSLQTLFAAKQFVSSGSAQILNIGITAQNAQSKFFLENSNAYNYDAAIATNFISTFTSTQTGSFSAISNVVRSVGLASKAFLVGTTSYFISTYSSPYQPTYFMMDQTGSILAKLAYSNGGGYITTGLPSVSVTGSMSQFSYLIKDLVQSVNKNTNVAAGTQTAGIYAQTGINLATIGFGSQGLVTSETGGNLFFNGGFLWGYDGYSANENNFHVYPDSVEVTNPGVVGSITPQTYYYQAVYEWSDNQGNQYKSAPSIPVSVVSSGSLSANVVKVPTNRLTYKTQNPLKIVLYRWSTAQQSYYQVTSITVPITNSTTTDSISFTDRSSDAAILGNNLLYTNGGVVENTGAPASNAMTLFDSRLWLISAEDPNQLWFSKQVLEATPVEMSDLFTLFVPPSTSAQGTTGPMKCLAPMDDKLIIFKRNAIYYINGSGPDNTGASSQYSQPTFITGTVGCEKQNSIVLTPNGLMFQSDKGIWLLGRDLSTQYIGKDVEAYNGDVVLSALTVPKTNEVRFTLASGVTLQYDYFVNQWGTFNGIPGISSTLYQNLHTYMDSRGRAFQETPGVYIDGSRPVLMSFTTGWINLAGLQGYKRVYKMYILGEYRSPHTAVVGVAYDYDSAVSQTAKIKPTNYSAPWGGDPKWGSSSVWGGSNRREQWQFNFKQQQCQSFQVSFNEYYDPTLGVVAGAGVVLSGLNLIAGVKRSYPGNVPVDHRIG